MSAPPKKAKPAQHKIEKDATPEKVTQYTYNVHTDKWSQMTTKVTLNATPFDEGSMRAAFFMQDTNKPENSQRYVAKMSKNPKEKHTTYFLDVEMQALAKLFAEEFNKRNPPKRVDFVEASVIKCLERQGQPLLGTEEWMDGTFEKYSNNYGFVSYDDRNTPQAFTHFTYCYSGGKLLICDIQGVGDKYTDPQIHSDDGKGFGKGNLGRDGMKKFFSTHRCNSICLYLKLPEHNPKQDDRGTTPSIEAQMKRLSIKDVDTSAAAAAKADEKPPSPRQAMPSGPPDDPLDLKLLGLNKEQFGEISKLYKQNTKEGENVIGRRGLVVLCQQLGLKLSLDEAAAVITKADVLNVGGIDLRQFLWWWCGIEES